MTRSAKKGYFVDERLMKKVKRAKSSDKQTVIKTWFRDCAIHPEFVGLTFGVYNGKQHTPVYVTENMVSCKPTEVPPPPRIKSHTV